MANGTLSISLSFISATSTSITVGWSMSGTNIKAGSYVLEDLSCASQSTNGSGTSGTYTFSGLSPSTTYTVYASGMAVDTSNIQRFASTSASYSTSAPPASPPSVSITATRSTPYAVSLTYSVIAPSNGGVTNWNISVSGGGGGSSYSTSGSLSAGTSTGTVTTSAAVTPNSFRYLFTISASNNGGTSSTSSYDLGGNPGTGTSPSGSVTVARNGTLNSLNVYNIIGAGSGTYVGRTYYTISGTGVPSAFSSGSIPADTADEIQFDTDPVLSPGSTYTYTLVVANNKQELTFTGSESVPAVAPPTNFRSLPAYLTDTSARLAWTASSTSGVTYDVYGSGGTVGSVQYDSQTSEYYVNITNLSPSTQYFYGIEAVLGSNRSATQSTNFTTIATPKTITPTISVTSSTDGTYASVSWSTTYSSGIQISAVEVSGPGFSSSDLSGSTTVYNLSPGSTYSWYIDVFGTYNGQFKSGSDSKTVTQNSTPTGAPSTPQDFIVRPSSTSTVSLSWAGSTSAGGYPPVTYYLSGPGTITHALPTDTYATVSGLSANTSYTWSLYAKNTKTSSPNTSPTISTSATTLASNSTTNTLVPNIYATSNAAGTEATITWTTVNNGATLYGLYAEVSTSTGNYYSSALNGSDTITGLTPGVTYSFTLYVEGYKKSGAPVAEYDTYYLTMSNPYPVSPPAPISNKTKVYLNGSWNNDVTAVKVYNGSDWVAVTPKTSDGQGHWT